MNIGKIVIHYFAFVMDEPYLLVSNRRCVMTILRVLLILLFVSHVTSLLMGQSIRPIRDSVGFCWNMREMDTLVGYLDAHVQCAPPPDGNLVAAISVHDDYLYAGRVYYPLYKILRAKEVVIFGVTHGTVTKELGPQSNVLIFDNFTYWQGPYGTVEVSPLRALLMKELPAEFVMVSDKAHMIEHSIEALIPFLQYYNRIVKITPIMVTKMPLERMEHLSERMAATLLKYLASNNLKLGEDLVILMSNDANHYGPDFNNAPYGIDRRAHELATENDRRIIGRCLTGEATEGRIKELTTEIWPDSTRKMATPLWCGRYPVTLGLLTTERLLGRLGQGPMVGNLLKYSDTFSEKVLPLAGTSMGLTAVFSYQHWCGWFTEAFFVRK